MTGKTDELTRGSFCLVLHGHLPYVLTHGTWPHGSDMLFECAAESYLPLLQVFDRLLGEGISPKVTIGLTPVLCEQLADPGFPGQFAHYLDLRITSAGENRDQFQQAGDSPMAGLAERWRAHFTATKEAFLDRYHRDIVGAYRCLQEAGHIEVITCAATHGYLPLIGSDECIQAQVKQAVASYTRHFGCAPRGFWLPECAYRPRYPWASPLPEAGPQEPTLRKGVEEFLAENGIQYFIVDTATLMGGAAQGVYMERFGGLQRLWEQFRASYLPGAADSERSTFKVYLAAAAERDTPPVAIFARDERTGSQVWSGELGYPGDGWYLDFHKKHYPGGHRYWRVTAPNTDLGAKDRYHPERAAARVPENADHFNHLVHELLTSYQERTGQAGVLCAPYDAELFGHWWFEGPAWLYQVCKGLHTNPEVMAVTCSEALETVVPDTAVALPESSWGQGGFHWIWLNDWTKGLWKHIYEAEAAFPELARGALERGDSMLLEVVRQAGRELLLLEASDWPFLISTWSARDYAERRAELHANQFTRLAEMAKRLLAGEELQENDRSFLAACSQQDALFPDLDLRWWVKLDHPATA